MIEFDDFRMNWRAAAVRHYEPIESQHHHRVTCEFAGRINVRDVPIDSGALVIAPVYHSGAERVSHFGINARKSVVEANPESHIIWNAEVLRRAKHNCRQDHDHCQSNDQAGN
jgi:hypothetical protein